MEEILERYLEIQQLASELQREKKELQEELGKRLEGKEGEVFVEEVKGNPVRIRRKRVTTVNYDEETLGERLGERYLLILRPDPKKMRREMDRIEPLLDSALDLIGSPDPDRVRAAIEAGRIEAREFAGAFSKTTSTRISVLRARPRDADSRNPPSEE